ncbi:cation transporter dimerization domain-containing protein [Belnapia sp. F-4-1]|uniref:cation transporter dimerization domain-containing protein n=1 Tax=Belnapia sp. F-4-1 TaxID=1545443 RepID=UPI0005B7D729|nr:cation transporter dimerization domain-containing protein [Belnapia sp. F-4-1]
MDAAPAQETLDRIGAVISVSANGASEPHDFRDRHAGRVTFIEFHLVVPREMSVGEAHDICESVEYAHREETGTALITIHVEPPHKSKQPGVLVLP